MPVSDSAGTAASSAPAETAPPAFCANCGVALVGAWCHACGQQRIDPRELQLGHHAREAADELLHLDSKTLRSLLALLVPGRLTGEYLAGRRQRYLSPLKVYLVCAAIFFVVAPWAGFTLDELVADDPSGGFRQLVDARVAARGIDRALFTERFDARLSTVYTLGLGASVVATALILAVLFRRREPRFGAHVVFALHYVAFLYLAAPSIGVLDHLLGWSSPLVATAFAYCIVTPYLLLALRRVFAEGWGATVAKAVVLLVATFVVDAVVNAAAFLLTLYLA